MRRTSVVAIPDLFPYGSSVGGFIVAALALTVSIPVCVASVVFYVVFRLLGAAWLGVVGALVAVPVAAVVQLLVAELVLPVLDEM